MISTSVGFELQGRASRVLDEAGVEQDATVFTGFAGQYSPANDGTGTVVQFVLNSTKDGTGKHSF